MLLFISDKPVLLGDIDLDISFHDLSVTLRLTRSSTKNNRNEISKAQYSPMATIIRVLHISTETTSHIRLHRLGKGSGSSGKGKTFLLHRISPFGTITVLQKIPTMIDLTRYFLVSSFRCHQPIQRLRDN